MGATLTGTKIQDTYSGLLKTSDSAAIGGTLKRINDGLGNPCPLYLSSTSVVIDAGSFVVDTDTFVVDQVNNRVGIGTASPQQQLHVVGAARFDGAIYDGNNSPGSAGLVLSSTGSGTDWISTMDNWRFLGDSGPIISVPDNQAVSYLGTNGISTISASAASLTIQGTDFSTFRQVDLLSAFAHASANPSTYNYMPFSGSTLSTSLGTTNTKVAPYAGRVRKIYMKNVPGGSTPTGTTSITFRIIKNSGVLYTSSAILVSAGVGQYAELNLGDSDATFAEGDTLSVGFITNGTWRNTGVTIVFEHTNSLI